MDEAAIDPSQLDEMRQAFSTLADLAAALAPAEQRRSEAAKHLQRIVELGDGLAARRDDLVRAVTDRADEEGTAARNILVQADIDAALKTVARAQATIAILNRDSTPSEGEHHG